ncbi:Pentatricopeptide repeat-containing protein [Capsicum annuum]|nr:Pentatricopeptide repeat-containing protein [Capsicum annuum]
MLSVCSSAGSLNHGKQIHSAAIKAGEALSVSVSNALITMYAKAGNITCARRVFYIIHLNRDTVSWTSMILALAQHRLGNEALELFDNMLALGMKPDHITVHEKVELAKVAADRLLSIDPENSGAYSTLANVYSSCGKWDEATKIRNSMKDKQVKKEQGFSWIQIKNIVHVFGVEDGIHPQRDAIYKTMEKIWKDIKKIGFIPDTASVLHDLDFEVNEQILRHHSEKLTIAFGLINTPENTTLRIMKNLRVCNDCHSAIKFISKLVGREIIVRDATRFHHFKGGSCSCNDYWSKHRNDPQTMKKLCQKHARKDKKKESGSKKRGHNSPKSKAPVKTRRVVEDIYRDELPKELSYVIKEIPSILLDLEITKCILMLEIEQPNQEEIHVFVKDQILRFSINEFALITCLNYFDNIDDFKYEDSSPSRLMKRYFPQSTNGVDKESLVERFLKENFENKEDALQMAILYFIHTFIYSQLNTSPVPFFDFKMIEDEKYQFFPWGKVSFSRLMALFRQEFSMEKQHYRLGGILQVLNMWMFEICSNVELKVVVKEGNNIPRILNWKYSYANIVPIANEFEKLDLAHTSFASKQHGTYSMPSSSKNQDQRRYRVNVPQVTEDHDSFDDFSSTLPQFLMRQSIHVSRTVSEPMTKTRKDVLIGRRSDYMKEKSKVDVDSTSTLNRKDLVVKADLHLLESEIKAYMKTYIDQKFKDLERLMNARFTEVLNSLEQKNETVKQSRQECDPSNAVVNDAGPTRTDSVVKETDKPVEMEDDKANQAPSFPKKVNNMKRDCGVFMVVYAEYLSEGLGISYSGIDAQYYHLRYAFLLCKYGFKK